jgi:hypothetical protein
MPDSERIVQIQNRILKPKVLALLATTATLGFGGQAEANTSSQKPIAAGYTQSLGHIGLLPEIPTTQTMEHTDDQYFGVMSTNIPTIHITLHKPPHHLTTAEKTKHKVTNEEFREWSKVNVCEEGGNWHVRGSEFSGGLGISDENWIKYGGQEFAQSAADATPYEQILVAMRIQKDPPDQNGCQPGGW